MLYRLEWFEYIRAGFEVIREMGGIQQNLVAGPLCGRVAGIRAIITSKTGYCALSLSLYPTTNLNSPFTNQQKNTHAP